MTFRPSPKRCAAYCLDAYEHKTITAGDIEVLVTSDSQALYFAHRGTTLNFSDIMSDLRGTPRLHDHLGWLHSGFYLGVRDNLWPHPKMQNILIENDLPIVVTGHSKGGAEALVLAGYMSLWGVPPVAVVTFGAPSVQYGSGLTDTLLNRAGVAVLQFIRGVDCVPDHPFIGKHVVTPTHIGPERDFWKRWGFSKDRFLDHKIMEYHRDAPGEW